MNSKPTVAITSACSLVGFLPQNTRLNLSSRKGIILTRNSGSLA